MPNASIVDERVFGDGDYTEHDRLLPEMINMEVCESKPPKKKRSCKCINVILVPCFDTCQKRKRKLISLYVVGLDRPNPIYYTYAWPFYSHWCYNKS
jgi:hypothetical protein